jgi:hypothetical protein
MSAAASAKAWLVEAEEAGKGKIASKKSGGGKRRVAL